MLHHYRIAALNSESFELKGIFVSFLPFVILLQPSTDKEEANKFDGLRKEKINGVKDNNHQPPITITRNL